MSLSWWTGAAGRGCWPVLESPAPYLCLRCDTFPRSSYSFPLFYWGNEQSDTADKSSHQHTQTIKRKPIRLDCPDTPEPIGCDSAVGGAGVPRQGGVVVTPSAGCGELVQDVLSLIGGHQTHTEQGKTTRQNKRLLIKLRQTVHKYIKSSDAL